MRPLFITLLFISFICNIWGELGYCKQEKFPFLGEINTDRVNVRAGESTNFERLCQLNHGDEVVVIGRRFSWYKIKLPSQARSFINSKYVRSIGNGVAEVIADRVNVRASNSITSSILAQLSRGSKVHIISDANGWYKIVPVDKSYGWISEKFISFKSYDIPDHSFISSTDRGNKLKPSSSGKEKDLLSKPKQVEEPTIRFFSAEGFIDISTYSIGKGMLYQLVIDKKPVCFLSGPDYIFSDFLNSKVKIEGVLDKQDFKDTGLPVVKVSKIELVL